METTAFNLVNAMLMTQTGEETQLTGLHILHTPADLCMWSKLGLKTGGTTLQSPITPPVPLPAPKSGGDCPSVFTPLHLVLNLNLSSSSTDLWRFKRDSCQNIIWETQVYLHSIGQVPSGVSEVPGGLVSYTGLCPRKPASAALCINVRFA
jgi:hypothetical protein